MLRAHQTAMPLAESQRLEVVIDEGVAEYDRDANWYVPVEELKAAGDPRWQEMLDGTWHTSLDIDPFQFRDDAYAAIERIIAANPSRRWPSCATAASSTPTSRGSSTSTTRAGSSTRTTRRSTG